MGNFARMGDLIRLLPDSVANQIAAGEVIQRPASAVKELLENSIDSGAREIKLIVREAGKLLIQLVDNGCGMSERDVRMCFERHATSKIQSAEDLFAIRTLGFRGEALASIASVAQVELRSKRLEDETGSCIQIDGSEFKKQFPVSCQNGTSVAVKNLFFNVPARRNFLKSNTLEFKYILEEFFRIALANPSIGFCFINQEKPLYDIPSGNLRQRIINLYGSGYNQRLIPIDQHSALVSITGFIGKPEYSKKIRGEQYFFTNGRFIKSPYLHHAVESAFKELIPKDAFPSYFILLEIDPKTIDVNIHPTKTEINFQEIKSIYAVLHAAVKQSVGKYHLSPTLDFDQEQGLDISPFPENHPVKTPSITVDPDYNPFEKKTEPQTQISFKAPAKSSGNEWQNFFEPVRKQHLPGDTGDTLDMDTEMSFGAFQVKNSLIVTHAARGIVIIHQQRAHERIIFEKLLDQRSDSMKGSQTQLIPQTVNLSPVDAHLMEEWLEYFQELGFDITPFGKNAYIIRAVPYTLDNVSIPEMVESLLEAIKTSSPTNKSDHFLALLNHFAKKMAIRKGKKLHQQEMNLLIENLFSCKVPEMAPDGKPTMVILSYDELQKKLKT